MDKLLKCRVCDWETLRWYRKKGSNIPSDGFRRLEEHYFLYHDEHLREIKEYAGQDDTDDHRGIREYRGDESTDIKGLDKHRRR